MQIHSLITFCLVLAVGVTVIIGGLANALEKADEKTPIVDSWVKANSQITLFVDARVNGRPIDVKTTKGVVMPRGKINSDSGTRGSKVVSKKFDDVKIDSEMVATPLRESVEDREDFTAMNARSELRNSAAFMPAV